jgi:hypothetical protein
MDYNKQQTTNNKQQTTNNKEKDIPRSKTYQEQKEIKCQ